MFRRIIFKNPDLPDGMNQLHVQNKFPLLKPELIFNVMQLSFDFFNSGEMFKKYYTTKFLHNCAMIQVISIVLWKLYYSSPCQNSLN